MIRLDIVAPGLIVAFALSLPGQAQDLPEAQGKAVVQAACTQCHGVDVLAGQPRSRDEWTDVVSRMVGNGAQLSDDDYKVIVDYLATHVGASALPAPASAPGTPAQGGGASSAVRPPAAESTKGPNRPSAKDWE